MGILIRGPEVLESTRAGIDAVVLDKTGTVTEGTKWASRSHHGRRSTAAELLAIAGARERPPEHLGSRGDRPRA